ncbi:hypothetical protein ACX3X6_06530 [Pseudomonas sichuanensis]
METYPFNPTGNQLDPNKPELNRPLKRLRKNSIRLHQVPDWSQRDYDFDQDPLWHTEVKPKPFEAIARLRGKYI